MKTRKSFRILCALLSLLLVSQFAVTAFAAVSAPWDQYDQRLFMVTTPNPSAVRYKSNVTIDRTSVNHSYGNLTDMSGYYDLEHSEMWAHTLVYGGDVVSTAAMDGYDDTHTMNNAEMYDTYGGIPEWEPTGNYKIKTAVLCRPIAYSIFEIIDPNTSVEIYVGEALAPYDFSNEITGYSA